MQPLGRTDHVAVSRLFAPPASSPFIAAICTVRRFPLVVRWPSGSLTVTVSARRWLGETLSRIPHSSLPLRSPTGPVYERFATEVPFVLHVIVCTEPSEKRSDLITRELANEQHPRVQVWFGPRELCAKTFQRRDPTQGSTTQGIA